MRKTSAGLILYRTKNGALEALLVHPGGPFWAKKDAGAWSIPKGEIEEREDPLAAAKREFGEETGFVPQGKLLPLGSVTQKGGKTIHAWAIEGNYVPSVVKSNAFEMEWPPKSGKIQKFPEVDRAEFFEMEAAKQKINPAQVEFLLRLREKIARA